MLRILLILGVLLMRRLNWLTQVVLIGIILLCAACGQEAGVGSEVNYLQKLYPPYTVLCEDCSGDVLDQAIDEWNSAAGIEVFMRVVAPPAHTLAYVMPDDSGLLAGRPAGVAQLFQEACLIQVEESHQFSLRVWTHELGHCIGFGHSDNTYSIMATNPPGEGWEITEEAVDIILRLSGLEDINAGL